MDQPQKPLRKSIIAMAAAGAVLLGACGVTNDDGSGSGTQTPAPVDVTRADLEALLPTEGAFGDEFVLRAEEADEEDDPDDIIMEQAMNKACPDAMKFFDDEDDDDDKVERSFEAPDQRTIEVQYDLAPRNLVPPELDEAIAAIGKCDSIEFTLTTGLNMVMDLEAQRDDTYGDSGVIFSMEIEMSHPALDAPVQFGNTARIFVVNGIGGGIAVGDGLEEISDTSLERIDRDKSLLDSYSAEIEANIRSLSD